MKRSYWLAAGVCALALPAVAACSSDPSTLGNEGAWGQHPGSPAPTTGTVNPSPTATGTNVNAPGPVPTTGTNPNQPPPGVPTLDAKTFFMQQVYPSLQPTCGACHGGAGSAGAPVYLGTNASDAYAGVEARGYISATSMLIKKGTHEGPALTSAQMTVISQWLQMEEMARGNNLPNNILAKLGNCLDKTKFDAIALKTLRTTPRTNENPNRCTGCQQAVCQDCHSQGEYGMHSNFGNLGTPTFTALQGNGMSPEGSYLIQKYITTNGTQLAPATAIMDKATVVATGPAYSHPMFTIPPAMATAIQDFANDAITKYNAKTCGQ